MPSTRYCHVLTSIHNQPNGTLGPIHIHPSLMWSQPAIGNLLMSCHGCCCGEHTRTHFFPTKGTTYNEHRVERQNSKILKDELKLHLSGLVSQSSTLEAGNWKGASSVVIAELVCGSTKSANIQVVEIESSEVKYHFINSIEREGSVKDLLSRFAEWA